MAYRAAKFTRRHRWPVAAAVVTIALLTAGLFVASRDRRVAENRFRHLRQLSEQVVLLDTRLNNLPGSVEARQSLVAMSLAYLEGLSADARSDRDLTLEVADHYARVARIQGVPTGPSLGNLVTAEASLKRADALVEGVLTSRAHDLRALELSARIRHDRMIVADSERRDADTMLRIVETVERIEAVLGDPRATQAQRRSVVTLYSNVALAALNVRRYDDAIRYATRQIAAARAPGFDPMVLSLGLSVLANAQRLQGHLTEALAAIREARALADATPEADKKRQSNRYGLLLREGFILGEDGAVSLERPAEALVPFREAFEMQEAAAHTDPKDATSRLRVGTAARELGDVLRWRDPREALAVYDIALGRLHEVKDNVTAQRGIALVLSSSAYALRRLDRTAEARRRIDEALALLAPTKDDAVDSLTFESERYTVLLALADHEAEVGHAAEATAQYRELLATVLRTSPYAEADLRTGNSLSVLYERLSHLLRKTGAADEAADVDAKRLALWQHWNRTLPNSPFVARRLASLERGQAGRR